MNRILGIFSLLLVSLFAVHSYAETADKKLEKVVFAGGCFWCMEKPYDDLDGVVSTISGYMGGTKDKANYKNVSSGGSGHYEVVQIEYDPAKVSYKKLVDVFWKNVDPFDARGQFCDKGAQYLSAIFYNNDTQKDIASKSLSRIEKQFDKKVATKILPVETFYAAEKYHQDYYIKNPRRYKYYRTGCGRDKRLNQLWGKS